MNWLYSFNSTQRNWAMILDLFYTSVTNQNSLQIGIRKWSGYALDKGHEHTYSSVTNAKESKKRLTY
jgi:hypothetical protein